MNSYLDYQGFKLAVRSDQKIEVGSLVDLKSKTGHVFGQAKRARKDLRLIGLEHQVLTKTPRENSTPLDIQVNGVTEIFWMPADVTVEMLPPYLLVEETRQIFEIVELLSSFNVPVLKCLSVQPIHAEEIAK